MTAPSAKAALMRLVSHFVVALTRDEKFNIDVLTVTPLQEGRRPIEIRGECAAFLKPYFEAVATDNDTLSNLHAIQAASSSLRWLEIKYPDVYSRALELNRTP
jgi:hypothetical protein